MKLTAVALGLTLCFALSAAAQDAVPGHFVPSDLPDGIIEGFTEAIRADTPWEVGDELAGMPHTMSTEERFVWAGSEIKAEMLLGNPTVKFVRPATEALPENAFTIEITFGRGRIVLRSSSPSDVKLSAGAALSFSADQSFRKFIPGGGDTGFVALIPKKAPSDWHGIAICPRSRYDDKQQHTLNSTNYFVQSVKVSAEGELKAKQRTGFSKGSIEGEVLASGNIPRAIPFERKVTAENPSLEIQYFADKDDAAAADVSLPYTGLRMSGRMVAPQGDRRSKKVEAFIRAVPFTPSKPITYYQDGASYSIEAGQCFAIIRGVLFEEEFFAK